MAKWTVAHVREHLQGACDLELFTLPLYLTAAYSTRAPLLDGEPKYDTSIGWEFDPAWDESQRAQWAFNLLYSVSVQEMLHLLLARNVATALGRTIVIDRPPAIPDYSTGGIVPHLLQLDPAHFRPEADIGPFTVKIGPLDQNQIDLFKAIEVPEHLTYHPVHACAGQTGPNPPYSSISAFYDALLTGINECWDELYPHENASFAQLFQYGAIFAGAYDPVAVGGAPAAGGGPPDPPYTREDAKKTIADMLHMIIWQGEGGPQAGATVYEKLELPRPAALHNLGVRLPKTTPGIDLSGGYSDDHFSHWARFSALKEQVVAGRIPTWGKTGDGSQWHMDRAYMSVLKVLTAGFDPANYPYQPMTLPYLNLSSMWGMGGDMAALWTKDTQPGWRYKG
jgi:hypothetical protein